MPTTTRIPAIIHRFLNLMKQVFASRSAGNLLDDEFAQLGETYTKVAVDLTLEVLKDRRNGTNGEQGTFEGV
ncbi:hypothetical protein B9Z55_000281 [Caenorhabditis nigoni]|uniref:Uncharacterized protein n=1 Tax=Caenorhabditis nigoni TaxID=1611254 RepID=A0A2G5VM37_9PELO|nr:hypothetical protein B9Z55_000281 [Caenorhabditis nigoni]